MRYVVAVPIFNEDRTLKAVLRQVRRFAPEILVVNDGSTDSTARLLQSEPGVYQIHHADNLGYGQSLIDAFQFALSRGFDWMITMDCDEQHEPERIPDFLSVAAEDDADIISGSRYLTAMDGNSLPPPDRRAINQKITDLFNEVLGLRITDAFCGFKAYRVSALNRINITVPGYGMPIQFWVQAVRQGLRVREIPVRLIYKDPERHFGGSFNDPEVRMSYYRQVLVDEMRQPAMQGLCATALQTPSSQFTRSTDPPC